MVGGVREVYLYKYKYKPKNSCSEHETAKAVSLHVQSCLPAVNVQHELNAVLFGETLHVNVSINRQLGLEDGCDGFLGASEGPWMCRAGSRMRHASSSR